MKEFRVWEVTYNVVGNDQDHYFALLPDHDLSALGNYFMKMSKIQNIRCCLDVGANIGLAALIMFKCAPQAHIYSFEPSPQTFSFLIDNLRSNGLEKNTTPVQTAVGEREGSVFFHDNPLSSGGNHIVQGEGSGRVNLVSLDAFSRERNISGVDFIKIDVEGFEHSVVAGARGLIARDKPVVMIEYNEVAIRSHAQVAPVDWIGGIIDVTGPLGRVDPLTGQTEALSDSPDAIVDRLANLAEGQPGRVFDLVNRHFD